MREHPIAIRWSDIDSYGHVNNAVYLNYLEECRDRWIQGVMGAGFDFVIARVAIDYRRELSLEDREVVVRCRGVGLGRSSIRTAEQVLAAGGWLAAEAESIVVAHDPVARAARPLTPDERRTLEAAIASDATPDGD